MHQELSASVVKREKQLLSNAIKYLVACMKTIMSNDKDIGKNQMNPLAMSAHHLHAKNSDKTFSSRQDLKEHVH